MDRQSTLVARAACDAVAAAFLEAARGPGRPNSASSRSQERPRVSPEVMHPLTSRSEQLYALVTP